jgi:hypothetical protein
MSSDQRSLNDQIAHPHRREPSTGPGAISAHLQHLSQHFLWSSFVYLSAILIDSFLKIEYNFD